MQKSISSNTLYKNIIKKLKEDKFLPLINSLILVASIFPKYLLIFQKDESLIHILHKECVSLLQQLKDKFLKADAFSGKIWNEYRQIQLGRENQVEDSNLEIGDKTRSHFGKLFEHCQKYFMLGVWEFYKVCTSYLLLKLLLTNIITGCYNLIQPSLRQEAFTLKGIRILGERPLVSVDIESLSDEWKLY